MGFCHVQSAVVLENVFWPKVRAGAVKQIRIRAVSRAEIVTLFLEKDVLRITGPVLLCIFLPLCSLQPLLHFSALA
jgi:hypothetical protein